MAQLLKQTSMREYVSRITQDAHDVNGMVREARESMAHTCLNVSLSLKSVIQHRKRPCGEKEAGRIDTTMPLTDQELMQEVIALLKRLESTFCENCIVWDDIASRVSVIEQIGWYLLSDGNEQHESRFVE